MMSYKDLGYAAASIRKLYHGDARHWIVDEEVSFADRKKDIRQCDE